MWTLPFGLEWRFQVLCFDPNLRLPSFLIHFFFLFRATILFLLIFFPLATFSLNSSDPPEFFLVSGPLIFLSLSLSLCGLVGVRKRKGKVANLLSLSSFHTLVDRLVAKVADSPRFLPRSENFLLLLPEQFFPCE